MFQAVKGFKKEDLRFVATEIGENVSENFTIATLKNLILKSKEYEADPEFVQELLANAISERKEQEQEQKLQESERLEAEKEEKMAFEKLRLEAEKEIELARIQAQTQNQGISYQQLPENNNAKKKFTLPKLQFRQFGDDLKDWLPFWSQFEHIDKDDEIAPENKFQYLVQATVVGSRAREVVESFPPTGENYAKAVDSLKARFGREDLLVEVYVRELLKLIISVQSHQKLSPTFLYDKLESYLRALETLGVTMEKCASILYPMVESCFDEEFLKAWNRNPTSSSTKDAKERLENLMLFLKGEVEGEERISLAMSGFGLTKGEDVNIPRKKKYNSDTQRGKISTASMLLTSTKTTEIKKPKCIFCDGKHASSDCFNAQKLTLEEKQKIVKEKNCCFACLFPGHSVKKCRKFLKCPVCSRKHVTLMCDKLQALKNTNQKKEEVENSSENDVNLSNVNLNPKVFLQTFKAKLLFGDKEKTVRVLCDTGSQKSYILKHVAEEMKYPVIRQETIKHSLFGGISTKDCKHNCYRIKLKQLKGNFTCNFEVLDQTVICENVLPVSKGPWLEELKDLGVILTDASPSNESIQVLIGADIMGRLLTGKRKLLSSGLVAVETNLGWTLMGKVPQVNTEKFNLALTVTSLFVKEASISDLWNLDVIGITDPAQKKSQQEEDFETKMNFLKTVTVNEEGRYEVALPWKEEHLPLPSYKGLALKRLEKMTKKLNGENLYEKYDEVLEEWHNLGIIDEVPVKETEVEGCYLPHRPVVKQHGTTKIRPVFDASAREKSMPSLNQCLNRGPNFLELIPNLLLRFRERKYGISADIEKAFLQISVREDDRKFLRFLWWNKDGNLRTFRHTRVVFGIISSPYLLSAVIDLHLSKYYENSNYDKDLIDKLKNSFYVDNVVTSVDSKHELSQFIENGKIIMSEGKFNLRDWKYTGEKDLPSTVLGISWNQSDDNLFLKLDWLEDFEPNDVTKRTILSIAHKVFDPIGFACPVLLFPKLLLQKMCKKGFSWDSKIDVDYENEFLSWFKDLPLLKEISIPRWFKISPNEKQNVSIHTFCDASKYAYAVAIFIRIEKEDTVEVGLLAAKSRVAPQKVITIPRLELIAALIGARLCVSVIKGLNYSHRSDINTYFWTDSTTVLAWIRNEEAWSVFVHNRVKEIKNLTKSESWHHVPGELNLADLPFRGCSAQHLMTSRWWESPSWLKENPNKWPFSEHIYD